VPDNHRTARPTLGWRLRARLPAAADSAPLLPSPLQLGGASLRPGGWAAERPDRALSRSSLVSALTIDDAPHRGMIGCSTRRRRGIYIGPG
jgi:hypothetical protein